MTYRKPDARDQGKMIEVSKVLFGNGSFDAGDKIWRRRVYVGKISKTYMKGSEEEFVYACLNEPPLETSEIMLWSEARVKA